MHCRVAATVGDRQHGNFDLGVLLFPRNRQRPKMRRRPSENDEHQQERVTINLIRDRRPTQQGWHCPRQSTDHNVLGRRTFEVERVNKGIADE